MLRKDGSRFWSSSVVTPIPDSKGRVAGFVKILRDRTDLRTHIDAFRRRADAAEALAGRRQVFLAAVAHELRNPLAAVKNAIRVLELQSHDSNSAGRAVAMIGRQVQFATRLLEDVADLTKVDRGTLQLRTRITELGPVLEAAIEACAEAVKSKQQNIKILASAPIEFEADPTRLQQVLVNLLVNASKFSPEGATVWLKATVEGDEIAIRVEDSGIGISGDFLPHMFDLFTQAGTANVSASSLASGMGLGLPLTKRIVELHHGTIEAKSDGPGTGTQMIVRLPVRQPVLPDNKEQRQSGRT
jgi:signal transduction histidine kinase